MSDDTPLFVFADQTTMADIQRRDRDLELLRTREFARQLVLVENICSHPTEQAQGAGEILSTPSPVTLEEEC